MTIKEAIDELESIKAETEYKNDEHRKVYKKESAVCELQIDALNKAIDALKKSIPVKTYKDDFFKRFPKAKKYKNGTPYEVCVNNLYNTAFPCIDCRECWIKKYKKEDALEKAINSLEKEIPVKTYKDDFFEKLPKAKMDESNLPRITCVNAVYGTEFPCGFDCDCKDCWMKEYPEKEEEV